MNKYIKDYEPLGDSIYFANEYLKLRQTGQHEAADILRPYSYTMTEDLLTEYYNKKASKIATKRNYIYRSIEEGTKIYEEQARLPKDVQTSIGTISTASYLDKNNYYTVELNNGDTCFFCNPPILLIVNDTKATINTRYTPNICRTCNRLYMLGLPKEVTLHLASSLMFSIYYSLRIIHSTSMNGIIALAGRRLGRPDLASMLHKQLLKVLNIFIEDTIDLLIYTINKEKEISYKLHKEINKRVIRVSSQQFFQSITYPPLDTTKDGRNYMNLNLDQPEKLIQRLQNLNLPTINSLNIHKHDHQPDELDFIKLMEGLIHSIDFNDQKVKSHVLKWTGVGDSFQRLFNLDNKQDNFTNSIRLCDFIQRMEEGKVNIHSYITRFRGISIYSLEYAIGALFYPERYIQKA